MNDNERETNATKYPTREIIMAMVMTSIYLVANFKVQLCAVLDHDQVPVGPRSRKG